MPNQRVGHPSGFSAQSACMNPYAVCFLIALFRSQCVLCCSLHVFVRPNHTETTWHGLLLKKLQIRVSEQENGGWQQCGFKHCSLVLGPRNYVTKVTLEQGCEAAAAMIHQHLF